MFVSARFLAHWTTAIVLNSVLPLIEHSYFLAFQAEEWEIKFLSPLRPPSRESKETRIGKKNKDWCVLKRECTICKQRENILAGVGRMKTALSNWTQDGSLYSAKFRGEDLSRLFKNVPSTVSEAVYTCHLFRLTLKQQSFLSSDVSSLWTNHFKQSIPIHCPPPPKFIEML